MVGKKFGQGQSSSAERASVVFSAQSEPNWQAILKEYLESPATMGGYYHALCEAIIKADTANIKRLGVAYPELVRLFRKHYGR